MKNTSTRNRLEALITRYSYAGNVSAQLIVKDLSEVLDLAGDLIEPLAIPAGISGLYLPPSLRDAVDLAAAQNKKAGNQHPIRPKDWIRETLRRRLYAEGYLDWGER